MFLVPKTIIRVGLALIVPLVVALVPSTSCADSTVLQIEIFPRGSVVELNFPRTNSLAKQKGQFARIKKGRVVRVDRQSTLADAQIGLGIAFE